MRFTVLGAPGFIGSHLAAGLRALGHECMTPNRDELDHLPGDLGHVFYCIGLTADFRVRPFDTVRAHVGVLADILERATFQSLLYISSTRVYAGSNSGAEDSLLCAHPPNPNDLYNLSKMTGECLCFATGHAAVRVARVSNVYGDDFSSDNFLASLIRDAVDNGHLRLETSLESNKDYVGMKDLVFLLPAITTSGRYRVYNVASGRNISHRELVSELQRASGCSFSVCEDAPVLQFPTVHVQRIKEEFGFAAGSLLEELPGLVQAYRKQRV